MKRKCRKAHGSIVSKRQRTVILAVCMVIVMFALTACGGGQTDPARSLEDAETGNSEDSGAVSSEVDVADREAEELMPEWGRIHVSYHKTRIGVIFGGTR